MLAEEADVPRDVFYVTTRLDLVAGVEEVLCATKLVQRSIIIGSTRVGKISVRQCSHNLKKLSQAFGGGARE